MENIKSRLREFAKYKGFSIDKFENVFGVKSNCDSPSDDVTNHYSLKLLLIAFPQLNLNWVLDGEGEMLLDDDSTNEDNWHIDEKNKYQTWYYRLLKKKDKTIKELRFKNRELEKTVVALEGRLRREDKIKDAEEKCSGN